MKKLFLSMSVLTFITLTAQEPATSRERCYNHCDVIYKNFKQELPLDYYSCRAICESKNE